MKLIRGLVPICLSTIPLCFFTYMVIQLKEQVGLQAAWQAMTHELRAIVLLDGSLVIGLALLVYGLFLIARSAAN